MCGRCAPQTEATFKTAITCALTVSSLARAALPSAASLARSSLCIQRVCESRAEPKQRVADLQEPRYQGEWKLPLLAVCGS
jgi:hypothetical protein